MPENTSHEMKADIDNGYTRIANLMLEAMACCPFTATEYATLLFIIRRTYGWARPRKPETGKIDAITAEEIAVGTGRPRRSVERAISDLKKAGVIIHADVGSSNQKAYGPNPNVYQWGTQSSEWKAAKVQLREAQDAGAYTQSRVDLYAITSIAIRNNAYRYTQWCVDCGGFEPDVPGAPASLKTVEQTIEQPTPPPEPAVQAQLAIPPEAFDDPHPVWPTPEPTPPPEPEPEPETRTWRDEQDPTKRAIWRLWSALGLTGVPQSDMKENGKGRLKQYSRWMDAVQRAGVDKAEAWAAVLERQKQEPPEGIKPGKWFGDQLKDGLGGGAFKWGWDVTQRRIVAKPGVGPAPVSREFSANIQEEYGDWFAGKGSGNSK